MFTSIVKISRVPYFGTFPSIASVSVLIEVFYCEDDVEQACARTTDNPKIRPIVPPCEFHKDTAFRLTRLTFSVTCFPPTLACSHERSRSSRTLQPQEKFPGRNVIPIPDRYSIREGNSMSATVHRTIRCGKKCVTGRKI